MSDPSDRDRARLEALKKLLAEDPRSLAFVTLAEEHNRLGEYVEAAAVAHRGLLTHPDSVAGRLALAVAEAEQDNVKEALEQIKRALLIDQENPKALALMGRILMKRGLAKRAVQFLAHAVKLAPKEPEYADLLRAARKQAKTEGNNDKAPVFDASQIPDAASPWTGDEVSDDGAEPGVQHTVFDPDAVKKLRDKGKPEALDRALASLPGVGDVSPDAEPTAFAGAVPKRNKDGAIELPPPRRVGEGLEGREEPTAHAAHNPLPADRPRRAKMGGSAAEFSQMMKAGVGGAQATNLKVEADDASDDMTVEGSKRPRSATTSDRPKPPSIPPAPQVEAKAASAPKAPPPPPPADPAPAPAAAEAKAASAPKSAPEKPAKDVAAAKKAAKGVGPVATRMVDEALWALFGQKAAVSAPAPAVAGEAGGAAPEDKPVRAKIKGRPSEEDEAEAGGKNAPGMVVRTSERFGTWLRVATMLVLAVAAAFIGYGWSLSKAGTGLEVSREELKGVATELERGGLASLLSAEDQIQELVRGNPELEPSLAGPLAEVYARRYLDFGRAPENKQKARAQISAHKTTRPSPEMLAAMVLLSTGAADRKLLFDQIEAAQSLHPDSPKLWLLKSRLLAADDREIPALEAMHRARAANPTNRQALLTLARYYGQRPALGPAFTLYEQLRERYPLDVEVAIERYVLSQVTGVDPGASQAVSTLAGLVRQEIPEVAKDEAGRAALAFAVPKLARGLLQEGMEELGKADAAFPDSALYRATVAGAFLTVGDFERARKHYGLALELEPNNDKHRIGLARAAFLERIGKKIDLVEEGKRIEKSLAKDQAFFKEATLPFGTISLAYGEFQVVKVEPDGEIFPESTYEELDKELDGPELQKALEAANLVALAQLKMANGKLDEAMALVNEAAQMRPSDAGRVLEGRILLAKKDYAGAVKTLKAALQVQPEDVSARLALSRALLAEQKTIDALTVLEGFEKENVTVPEALHLLAAARIQRGDYEHAVGPLEQVTALGLKGSGPYLALGEVKHKLLRPEQALEAYKQAIDHDPKLGANGAAPEALKLGPIALMYLGRVELPRNEKRGQALFKECLKFEEAPPEAYFYLGQWLVVDKKNKKGRKELEHFVKIAPAGDQRDEAERLLRKK